MPLSQKKLIPSIFLVLALAAFAVPPLWWSAGVPPVIAPGATENNQGLANIGQAKHMAKSALDALRPILPAVADEIEADLTEGTNPILDFTIPDSKTPEWIEKQKASLLIGQLKAISAPFYTRLNATNPTWLEAERTTNATNHSGSIFPWTTTTADDANKAIATIGQLKAVFALRFESLPPQDSDGDGMPDAFETAYRLNPNASSDASGDQDSDGLTNLQEYQKGTNPNNPDTDGDGLTDEQEISLGTDPNNPDTDGDGLTDEQEILLGTNPLVSDNPGIAQESITNGDFTNPRIKTGIMRYSDWDVWTSMPYWTAIVGSNIEYQTIEPLAAGNQYCELKAHTSGHHGIQQTIGTVRGKTYLIVLDCKARSGDALTDSEFKIRVDDKATPSTRLIDQTVTFNNFNWTQAAATFTATSSITIIGLLPTNLSKPTRGCLVDNVRLIPMDLLPVEVSLKAIGSFNNVDDHIDPWTGKTDGKRIFPDYKDPDHAEIQDKLEVIVKTSSALAGMTVYVKSFDVDDSTPETVDKANLDNPASPPVVDPLGNAGGDNMPDYKSTPKNGQFWTGAAWGANTDTGVVDANGETKFIFGVGMQPGSNYRIVASLFNESMYAGVQTDSPSAPRFLGPEPYQNGKVPASPLLTVWRKLWVENDSMEEILNDADGNHNTYLTFSDAMVVKWVSTTIAPGKTAIGIPDPQDRTSFSNLEHGFIKFGGNVYSVKATVRDSGEDISLVYVLIDGVPPVGLTAGIGFRLYDDDDFGVEGALLPRNDLLSDPDEHIKKLYEKAFIDVEDAAQWNDNKTIPFFRNHPLYSGISRNYGVLDDSLDGKLEGNENLWCASVVIAYQGAVTDGIETVTFEGGDGDPNSETTKNDGLTPGEDGRLSVVWAEQIRELKDSELRTPALSAGARADVFRRIRLTAAHEMGHVPLYSKGNAHHAEKGQMGEGGQPASDDPDVPFAAESLRRFRGVWKWRQKE